MDAAAIIQVDDSMLDKCWRSASHASENAVRTTDNRTYSPSVWAITTSRFIGGRKGDDYCAATESWPGAEGIRRGKPADTSEKNWAERRPEIGTPSRAFAGLSSSPSTWHDAQCRSTAYYRDGDSVALRWAC